MLVRIFEKMNSVFQIIILKIIYGNRLIIGKNLSVRGKFNVRISQNASIVIGDNCFFNNGCSLNAKEKIKIGNDCLFGENVKLYDHDHVYDKRGLIRENGYKTNPIDIGNNVWICSDVIVLRKTAIENNCVIAAKEIVKGRVEENQIFLNGETRNIEYR